MSSTGAYYPSLFSLSHTGDTSIEALIREKIPGWINGQQTMKKRISKENHKIPSLSQVSWGFRSVTVYSRKNIANESIELKWKK